MFLDSYLINDFKSLWFQDLFNNIRWLTESVYEIINALEFPH